MVILLAADAGQTPPRIVRALCLLLTRGRQAAHQLPTDPHVRSAEWLVIHHDASRILTWRKSHLM